MGKRGPQPQRGLRVLGPYPLTVSKGYRGKHRVVTRGTKAGKAHSEEVRFASRVEAEEYAEALRQEYRRLGAGELADVIHDYCEDLRTQGLTDTTIEDARVRLKPLLQAGITYVEELTPRHVRSYLNGEYAQRRQGEQRSVSTRRGHLKRLRMFLDWCRERDLLLEGDDPTKGVTVKGKAKRGKSQLTQREATKFRRYCELTLWPNRADEWTPWPIDDRRRLYSEVGLLLLMTGARSGELRGMRVRDLSLDESPAVWTIEETKTDAGRRVVELAPDLAGLLRQRIEGLALDDLVYQSRYKGSGKAKGRSERYGRHWLPDLVRERCEAAGVSVVTPHGLRGTLASLTRRAAIGVDVIAGLLGHESGAVTSRHYVDGEAETAGQVVDLDRARGRLGK